MVETEEDLIARCRRGDRAAFDALVLRIHRRTFVFCLRLAGRPEEADELCQRGFVALFRHAGQYRGEGSFRRWFSSIVMNEFRSMRRTQVRERSQLRAMPHQEESVAAGRPRDPDPDLHVRVRRAVGELPPRQREILLLHAFQGLSYAEIAEVLGCGYNDVKTHISLARKRLKERLKDVLTP